MKILIAALAGALAAAVPLRAQAPATPAQVLAAFTQRVNAYDALRKGAEKGAATLDSHNDPAKIDAERNALAMKIRTARATAKAGDIFTPDTRPVFRRLLTPSLTGTDGQQNKAAIRDDNPGTMTVKINMPYPKAEPLSTVPPDVLKALPVLPKDLEYRFVGKHLILYDARAGLVVDYIPNVIP